MEEKASELEMALRHFKNLEERARLAGENQDADFLRANTALVEGYFQCNNNNPNPVELSTDRKRRQTGVQEKLFDSV
ncbi:MAG: hypothetical protein ACLPJJ_01650 [Acidocella sp.]|uniref:hypothetical protein n=1 Tax=Acidocella sp. TaxID=50710 RepID=UPI003FD8413D